MFLISEVKLIIRNEKPFDLFGLIIFVNLPLYVVVSTLLPFFLMYFEWDPVYLGLNFLYPKYFTKLRTRLLDIGFQIIFKLVGFTITTAASQCTAVVMRNYILLTNGMASSFFRLLEKCVSYPACRYAFLLYNNIYVCYSIVVEFSNSMCGLQIITSILVIIVSTRSTIIALKTGSVIMGVIGIFVIFFSLIVSHCVFTIGRFVFETTTESLRRWKFQAKVLGRPLLFKNLVAIQPIMIRLGSLHRGVISVKMEIDYLNVVLSVIVNVVILNNK